MIVALKNLFYVGVGFNTANITVLYTGFIVIFGKTQFQYHFGHIIVPTVFVEIVHFGQFLCVEHMVITAIVCSKRKFNSLTRIFHLFKIFHKRSRNFVPPLTLCSGSERFSTPKSSAIEGIICIKPPAPAHELACGSNPDSW